MNRWRNESAAENDYETTHQFRESSRRSSHVRAVYPQILEDQELIDDNPSSISDSRPCEEDATSTSFHTAKSHESRSLLHRQESHTANSSSDNFLSCHEGSDRSEQCWIQLPADVESTSLGFPEQFSDLDEMSFHTCPRFNEQGLRSALSVPTKKNNDGQFNIPLQVFAASIEKAAEKKETEKHRRRLLWLPLKIFGGIITCCCLVALIVWLSTLPRTEKAEVPALVNSPTLAPSVRSNNPLAAPLDSSDSTSSSSIPRLFGSLTSTSDYLADQLASNSETAPSAASVPTTLPASSNPPMSGPPSPTVLALDETSLPSSAAVSPQEYDLYPSSVTPTLAPMVKSKNPPKNQASGKDDELPSIIGLLEAASSVAPSAQPSPSPPHTSPPTFWIETGSFVLIEAKDHEGGLG